MKKDIELNGYMSSKIPCYENSLQINKYPKQDKISGWRTLFRRYKKIAFIALISLFVLVLLFATFKVIGVTFMLPFNASEEVFSKLVSNSSSDQTGVTYETTTVLSTTTTENISDREILASIIVNRATVPKKDYTIFNGDSDTFVDAYVDGLKIGSTNVIKNNNNPQWNHHFLPPIMIRANSDIVFEIYDKDLSKNEFIGKVLVSMSSLISNKLSGKTISMSHGDGQLWFTVEWSTRHYV